MALKSIVEIEVDDTKFQNWLKQVRTVTVGVNGGTASQPNSGSQGVPPPRPTPPNNQNNNQNNRQNQEDLRRVKNQRSLDRATKEFSDSLKHATASLLKFGALTLAAGAGFRALSRGTESSQFASRGLGVTTAQKTAFERTYRQFVEPDSFLQKVLQAQQDPSKRVALEGLLGISDIENKDVTDLAAEAVQKAKSIVEKDKPTNIAAWLKGSALSDLFDVGDIKRAMETPSELYPQKEQERKTLEESLRQSQKVQDSMASLAQDFDSTGDYIKKSLVDFIDPLTPVMHDFLSIMRDIVDLLKPLSSSTKEFGDKWRAKDIGSTIEKLESSGKNGQTSKAGAKGVRQIMPGTWETIKRNHPELNLTDIWNPEQNRSASDAYINDLGKKYNWDIDKVLGAYNWGPGHLDNAIKDYGDKWLKESPDVKDETKNYIKKFHEITGGSFQKQSFNGNVDIRITNETSSNVAFQTNRLGVGIVT